MEYIPSSRPFELKQIYKLDKMKVIDVHTVYYYYFLVVEANHHSKVLQEICHAE